MSSESSQDIHDNIEGGTNGSLPDPSSSELIRRILAISDQRMKRATIEEYNRDVGASRASQVLQEIIQSSVRGDSRARDAWLPIAQWIIEQALGDEGKTLNDIVAAADRGEHTALAKMLRFDLPRTSLPKAARARNEATRKADSLVFPLSESVRQWHFYRAPSYWTLPRSYFRRGVGWDVAIERLATVTCPPLLARRVIENDWFEIGHLLALIAKRPLNDTIAYEAILSDRWCTNPRLHDALAYNPFTPPEIVNPLLPVLSLRALERLAGPSEVRSSVYDAAVAVLECVQT
jgi:hypothetical protein